MFENSKNLRSMTSQELEEQIRKHREYVKGLLAEAKLRREQARKVDKKISSK